MKFAISILLLIFYASLSTQIDKYVGTYEIHSKATDGSFELRRNITLNADGTFIFHDYNRDEKRIPWEANIWGKGKWKADKNQIQFSANEEIDIDEKYSLNFNNTKARYKTKSPRDISNKIVKTSLIFYESDIRIVKGHLLVKKE